MELLVLLDLLIGRARTRRIIRSMTGPEHKFGAIGLRKVVHVAERLIRNCFRNYNNLGMKVTLGRRPITCLPSALSAGCLP
jgi:hypothetical protein